MNIIKVLRKLITDKQIRIINKKPILGRWNIETDISKTNSKIDLSNEDHCGPCGYYANNKKNDIQKINN